MLAGLMFAALLLSQATSPEMVRHVQAGLQAKKQGRLDEAIAEFKQVTALAPNLAAAHMNLAAVYQQKRDYRNAIPELRRTLELDPNLPGAHGMLGMALLAQGYAAEAIPHLERGELLDALGVALLDSGRPADAVPKLESALGKRPDDPDLLYYLGKALGQLSRQALDRVLEAHPDSPRAHQLRADEARAQGRSAEAEQEYRRVLAARPDLPGIHLALAELHLQASDLAQGETELRKEIELSPGSAEAAWRLGSVLLKRARTREALAELERANRLRPDMPETLYDLAKAQLEDGQPAPAEKNWLRVIELDPASSLARSAHLQLSQLYRRQGKQAEADLHLRAFQAAR